MTVRFGVLLGAFFALLTIPSAHADEVQSAYVSANGSDSGNCDNPAAPCRSIGYALQRVGKLGDIRVAAGRYSVSTEDELFYLLGDSIEIRGGYDAATQFRSQTDAQSVLVGVPLAHSDTLRARGFHTVSDGKSLQPEQIARTEQLLARHEALQLSGSQGPCVGGNADGFACDQVDLLAHVALGNAVSGNPANGNDIWGFIDLNTNREYALMGYNIGMAVFDVTDPTNPREIGYVDGQNTVWRDIKVFQTWNETDSRYDAYAYVTTDGSSDGLFVIDLTDLPHSISRINYASDFSAAHNIYATNVDFATGLSLTNSAPALIVAGANRGVGEFRLYNVANPENPTFGGVPTSGSPGYMHDAASMLVYDSRKDSQCVNAASSPYCEVLFDFNENTVDIWDITNLSSPALLSRTGYAGARYVHSGWWTDDKQYLLVHDELDEQNFTVGGTTVRVFSLANLTSPSLVGQYTGATNEIDHNGFTLGNRYYMSNYSRGLSVLDVSNPTTPTLIASFDTFPGNQTGASFSGAWGVYPFLPSGTIAVSDRDSGLYLVSDQSLSVAQGNLGFAASSFAAAEGQTAQLSVSRLGGTTGAVSVSYELLAATGNANDVTGTTGTLNWAAGDSADKVINLPVTADGQAEDLERLLVRLHTPTGGATLTAGANISSLYMSEAGSAAEVAFSVSSARVAERGFATGVAVIHRTGSAIGAASVDYALSAGDATAGTDFQGATSGTAQWADGDADPKWIEFPITDDGAAEGDEFFELTLSNASGASIGANASWQLTIADGTGVNTAPNAVAGADQTVDSAASVTLSGTGSNDPDGDPLTYQWTQSLGPAVTLSGATTDTASFTAPSVNSDTLLQFQLTVSDNAGNNDVDVISVTVRSAGGGGGGNGGGGGGGGGGALGIAILMTLFGVLLWRRRYLNA